MVDGPFDRADPGDPGGRVLVDPCPPHESVWLAAGDRVLGAAETGRSLVAWALACPPDAGLAGMLGGLDPTALDPDTRVDLVVAWNRLASWVDAQTQVALAAVVAATRDTGLEGSMARHEVGMALRLSPGTAYARVERAVALTGRLSRTWAALAAGTISGLQAGAVADAVADLDDQVAAAVQDRVLAKAGDQTVAELKRSLARTVIDADPAGAAARAETARAGRGVHRWSGDDGMAELRATLGATETERMWAELTAQALAERDRLRRAGTPGLDGPDDPDPRIDGPGMAALRADALVRAVLGDAPATGTATPGQHTDPTCDDSDHSDDAQGAAGRTGDAGDRTGDAGGAGGRASHAREGAGDPGGGADPAAPRPATGRPSRPAGAAPKTRPPVQLQVTIDLPTLLGLAQHPAELRGYGPVPPHLARELAGDADWVRFLTDPQTGQLLDLGRRRYRPSERLAAYVRAAMPTCRWRGCGQPADRCDLDHIIDFDHPPDVDHPGDCDGDDRDRDAGSDRRGETTRANLCPRCRQHHNAKTHGGWRHTRDPDGTEHVTSPLGKTYTVPPDTVPPDWQPPDRQPRERQPPDG